jgi:hypothetical protein
MSNILLFKLYAPIIQNSKMSGKILQGIFRILPKQVLEEVKQCIRFPMYILLIKPKIWIRIRGPGECHELRVPQKQCHHNIEGFQESEMEQKLQR